MIKLLNNKKNKILAIIIAIIIIVVIIISHTISEKEKSRQYWINYHYEIAEDVKPEKWRKVDDAIYDVRLIFNKMREFTDKNDSSYDSFRKKLSREDIWLIMGRYYNCLEFDFGIKEEDADKLLNMFIEGNEEGYNSFDSYTKYLGEKAYYSLKNSDCSAHIYTTINNDNIKVSETYYEDEIYDITYKLILKDKDFKILDIIETERFNNTLDKDNTVIDSEIEIKNVEKVEHYFTYCYD